MKLQLNDSSFIFGESWRLIIFRMFDFLIEEFYSLLLWEVGAIVIVFFILLWLPPFLTPSIVSIWLSEFSTKNLYEFSI